MCWPCEQGHKLSLPQPTTVTAGGAVKENRERSDADLREQDLQSESVCSGPEPSCCDASALTITFATIAVFFHGAGNFK